MKEIKAYKLFEIGGKLTDQYREHDIHDQVLILFNGPFKIFKQLKYQIRNSRFEVREKDPTRYLHPHQSQD